MKATKQDLITYIQKETGASRPAAAGYADCMIGWLTGAIGGYETIELRGLGTFDVTEKPEHKSRFNPDVIVPARRKVKFRPGKVLTENLKNRTAET